MTTLSNRCVMPTNAKTGIWLVDTSVAVALLTMDHVAHDAVFDAIAGRRLGLAGHAAYETYSVLTRLPPPARRTPAAVGRLLTANFPHSRFLSPGRAAQLLVELADNGFAGGSVYDALVAAPAIEHALPLVSRDRRALSTYRDVGADVEFLS